MTALLGRFALAFGEGLEAVDRWDGELLDEPAGPMDFEGFDRSGGTDAEVGAHIGCRCVAATGEDVGALACAVGGEVEGCANGIAGGFGAADEAEGYPVVRVGGDVAEERRGGVDVVDDGGHVPVVEEVSYGQTAGGEDLSEGSALDCWDWVEALALLVME